MKYVSVKNRITVPREVSAEPPLGIFLMKIFSKSIKMYKPDTNVGDKGKISQYNKKGGENPRKNYLEEIDP